MEAISITLTGAPDKIRRVVDFWGGLPPELAEGEPEAITAMQIKDLVKGLTSDGRRTVRMIASRSINGETSDQDALWRQLLFVGEQQLNGVLGGVGNQWKRVSRQKNPFIRRWDEQLECGYYQVDRALAKKLLEALTETE